MASSLLEYEGMAMNETKCISSNSLYFSGEKPDKQINKEIFKSDGVPCYRKRNKAC